MYTYAFIVHMSIGFIQAMIVFTIKSGFVKHGKRLILLFRVILPTLQVHWSEGKWGETGLESRLRGVWW